MNKSNNYNFYLPSRDTDDIADINQISENFVAVDEILHDLDQKTAPATDTTYGTIKTPTMSGDTTSYGLYRNDQGFLQIVPANESHIDNRGWLTTNCPITPNNLDYAVKAVTYDKTEIDEKTAPARPFTLGTIKLAGGENGNDQQELGLYLDNGALSLVCASKSKIDDRTGLAVICPKNLDYAVKSVGDGYYALASDVGDIDTALDAILAMQENLIGGDA